MSSTISHPKDMKFGYMTSSNDNSITYVNMLGISNQLRKKNSPKKIPVSHFSHKFYKERESINQALRTFNLVWFTFHYHW